MEGVGEQLAKLSVVPSEEFYKQAAEMRPIGLGFFQNWLPFKICKKCLLCRHWNTLEWQLILKATPVHVLKLNALFYFCCVFNGFCVLENDILFLIDFYKARPRNSTSALVFKAALELLLLVLAVL